MFLSVFINWFSLVIILANTIDFDKPLEVIEEVARINEYDDNMTWKLVQKQKLAKEIRPANTITNERKLKIMRSPILNYLNASNGLARIFRNTTITLITSKHNNILC